MGWGSEKICGGVEAGGTKFVCLVASGPESIVDQIRLPTTTPHETLDRVVEFFQPYALSGRVTAIGVGSFGPLDLDRKSATFGHMTSTPKPGWQDADIVGPLERELDVRVTIDTDVNAAALGEFTWGASHGLDPSLYLTIGTGIGGGCIVGGQPLVGMLAPEMGHIRVPHDLARDPFPGSCPFHGDCFEGLASGTAIEQRLGTGGESLRHDDPFWELETDYIAAALINYVLTLSPRKIVLGGGVMQSGALFSEIRSKLRSGLNGYLQHRSILEDADQYVVGPGLGGLSGGLGAIALAHLAEAR